MGGEKFAKGDVDQDVSYDLRLKTPFTLIAAGPSRSGKTSWVYSLLSQSSVLLDRNPHKVFYFYNQWQPLFDRMQREKLVNQFVNHLPDKQELEKLTASGKKSGRGSLCIIDDFMNSSSEHVGEIFTALSHHLDLSCIYITQNLFAQNNKYMRDMSLSASYLVLFKNPRDQSQIVNLAKQLAPGNTKFIVDSFRHITSQPYSYVMYDLHQSTPEIIRVRTNLFVHEHPMKVVVPSDDVSKETSGDNVSKKRKDEEINQ